MRRPLIALVFATTFAGLAQADDHATCENTDNADAAIRACSHIIALGKETRTNLATAYDLRGQAYENKGDHDRAIADFNKSLELNPNKAAPYVNRGRAYSGKGDYDPAIADYDRAVQLDPKDAWIYDNRGPRLRQQRRARPRDRRFR